MAALQTIRIFASSPGDVEDERNQLARIVQELNLTLRALVPERPINVELIRWETHVSPGMGRDPQDVVDEAIGRYEIFVGMMWSRFGTPTTTAGSGTEAEFRDAYRGWEERRIPSHILFYFCDEPIPTKELAAAPEQYALVTAFRNELQQKGLIGSYEAHAGFADTVRPDLIRVLSQLVHRDQEPSQIAERTAAVSEGDLAVVAARAAELAHEYEQTRASMSPGDARTRQMEVVASKMRTTAQSTYALLPRLVNSASPGERLVAISVLQVIPDSSYLDWLGARIAGEKPFVGYHAAVALLAASRSLPLRDLAGVEQALDNALEGAKRLRSDADRAATLGFVKEELKRRRRNTAEAAAE